MSDDKIIVVKYGQAGHELVPLGEYLKIHSELTTIKEQNKKLRECVEFYANTTSWENEHTEACHTISGIITEKDVYQPWGDAGISVGGRSAKKCLEEIERMG